MENTEKKDLIRQVLANEMLGIIASISHTDMQLQSALVAITETDQLELIFGTSNTTRKYQNIRKNPQVSLVIGADYEKKRTVQYEGRAKELSGDDLETYRNLHLKKHPTSREYVFSQDERMFLITPQWIRYSDYNSDPKVIFEISRF